MKEENVVDTLTRDAMKNLDGYVMYPPISKALDYEKTHTLALWAKLLDNCSSLHTEKTEANKQELFRFLAVPPGSSHTPTVTPDPRPWLPLWEGTKRERARIPSDTPAYCVRFLRLSVPR